MSLKDVEEKLEIMKCENRLKGTKIFKEDNLIYDQKKIQSEARYRAKEKKIKESNEPNINCGKRRDKRQAELHRKDQK